MGKKQVKKVAVLHRYRLDVPCYDIWILRSNVPALSIKGICTCCSDPGAMPDHVYINAYRQETMIVAELIEALQKYPGNAVVLKESYLGHYYLPLSNVPTRLESVELSSHSKGTHAVYMRAEPLESGFAALIIF